MKKHTIRNFAFALPFIAFSTIATVNATDYQHEVSIGSIANTEAFSDNMWAANYSYYLAPVEVKNRPYALYDFFHQGSKVETMYSNFDGNNAYGIGGRYVLQNNWFVDLSYAHASADHSDSNSWVLGGGYYLNENTSLFASYSRNNNSLDDNDFIQGEDLTNDSFGIGAKSFVELDTTSGLMLSAGYTRQRFDSKTNVDSLNIFNVAADWYLTNSWSVGMSHIRDSDDNFTQVSTGYTYHFANSFYFTGQVARAIDSDAEGVVVGLTLSGRF